MNINATNGTKSENREKILLESGTNEVEMMEFYINNQLFAVNVAKVQSLLRYEEENLTLLSDAPKSIRGLILIRETTLPLIDLNFVLGIDEKKEMERRIVILMTFNNTNVAMLVDGVNGINRISWNFFNPISEYNIRLTPGAPKGSQVYLGNFVRNGKNILILDCEKIVADIFPSSNIEMFAKSHNVTCRESRNSAKIIHIDDSSTVRTLISNVLKQAGYTNLTSFQNGQDAYEYLKKLKEFTTKNNKRVDERVDIIICDIEMPQMDGLTLCKRIRDEFVWPDLPVIMFSSLIDEQMKLKCESVGATTQITKPEINNLISLMDRLMSVSKLKEKDIML
ncbi:MAG: chemotaxis protein CheV [Oligoflexia bacterium]|nr:chemotaxis protein CheV [Oligoflexia bacterium]